jgi:hypothetical protein
MSTSSNEQNANALDSYPQALFVAVTDAVPRWVSEQMVGRIGQERIQSESSIAFVITEAVTKVQSRVQAELHQLLITDVDQQRMNPLHVLRDCMLPATEALQRLQIPMPRRDEYEKSAMPNDLYALGPVTWRDLSEEVHDAGINWGAFKAAVVLSRRRAEGKLES